MHVSIKRLYSKDISLLRSVVTEEIASKANLPWPFLNEDANNFINNYHTYGIYLGVILVGALEVKNTGETAYFISAKYRNKGYTTTALKLANAKYPEGQLWCIIHPTNSESMRVATKAGLRIQFFQGGDNDENNTPSTNCISVY